VQAGLEYEPCDAHYDLDNEGVEEER